MSEHRQAVITFIQSKVVELNPAHYQHLENPTPETMLESELEAWRNGDLDIDIIMDGAPSQVIAQLL